MTSGLWHCPDQDPPLLRAAEAPTCPSAMLQTLPCPAFLLTWLRSPPWLNPVFCRLWSALEQECAWRKLWLWVPASGIGLAGQPCTCGTAFPPSEMDPLSHCRLALLRSPAPVRGRPSACPQRGPSLQTWQPGQGHAAGSDASAEAAPESPPPPSTNVWGQCHPHLPDSLQKGALLMPMNLGVSPLSTSSLCDCPP